MELITGSVFVLGIAHPLILLSFYATELFEKVRNVRSISNAYTYKNG